MLRPAGIVAAILLSSPLFAADTPVQVQALQDHLRATIDAAEPGIAAIVVSSNPAYKTLTPAEKARPGVLGGYETQQKPTDGIVPTQRDRLDLSDYRNAADNNFGSGIVLDRDGRVLTSYHLIENAVKIYVRFADGKGSYADIHAADARSDLAVLRMQSTFKEDRKPVKFANVRLDESLKGEKATVYRGQFVFALAHPFAAGFNDGQASVSSGLISSVRRRSSPPASEQSRESFLYQYSNLLQTDARLNLGASGGALLNLDGEVIGLLTATAAVSGSETSGGYAVPMDPVYRRIVEVLKEGREVEYGFLGVSPDHFEDAEPRRGLVVRTVSPGTPAQDKLVPNDIIQAVDGRPVRERDDLYLLIGGSLAGSEITLSILHGREKRLVTVTLEKFGHSHASIASVRPEALFGLRVDYSSLLAQQPMFVGEFRQFRRGVTIRDLEPGSPAAAKLQPFLGGKSMLITAVNGQEVHTPPEFYKAAKGARRAILTIAPAVDDGGGERTVVLP